MKKIFSLRSFFLVVVFVLLGTQLAFSDQINVSWGVAIKGYDPVAYFIDGKPVKGSDQYSFEWNGAKWRFSTDQNRKLFMEHPEKYAPQYGGFCAYGVSQGKKVGIDPKAWSISDGKLYLNYDLDIHDRKWLPNQKQLIKQADDRWKHLK
jgi:YHS domain-containing protein